MNLLKLKNKKNNKENWKIKLKKLSIVLIALIVNCFAFLNASYAANINSADLHSLGYCGNLLKYKGVIVKVAYVVYTNDKINYPAYCLDKTKQGVGDITYSVSVTDAIKDVRLWRIIINGYPYKTIEELGVANKEEAFTATKQAVYCYIHGNRLEDYEPIGEAGVRTLNAMKKIVNDANNSTETKISSTITINKNDGEWKQDSIDKNYVSKTYSVSAGAQISDYIITLTKEGSDNLGGIKLTDEENHEQFNGLSLFKPNQKFKILIPIKNLTEDGEINIEVSAQIKTKPLLYVTAPSGNLQDYALTGDFYENGNGNAKDNYYKNETKIIIVKKDQETGNALEGVELQLLDENKNVAYTDLKTDKEGKIIIDNLIPGTYYLKETKTIDGYELYENLINVDISLNQEMTVTVNNNKEDEPKIETKEEKSKEILSKDVAQEKVKKLPVTGM